MVTRRIGTPRMVSFCASSGRRAASGTPGVGFCKCTMSLRRILRRQAVSPNTVRMLSSPSPRTSRKSLSSSGQRPSSVSDPMRETSTTSSATSPCPREISSRPSSLLPTPESPVISTPMPSTSMKTPCSVPVSASCRETKVRRVSITNADDSGVCSNGMPASSQPLRTSSLIAQPSATMIAGGRAPYISCMWCATFSGACRADHATSGTPITCRRSGCIRLRWPIRSAGDTKCSEVQIVRVMAPLTHES